MGWIMARKEPPTELVDETLIPDEEPHEPDLAELNKVESIVASLAKLLSTLLAKSSILCDLDLNKLSHEEKIDPELAKLLKKPRIDLAQKILKGYWKGQLPLFNDIICTRFPTVIQDSAPRQFSRDDSPEDWPPPLPEISNKDMEALVFMHSSFFNLHLYVTELEASSLRNNERLEFLGDAVLERAVCDLLYFRFPADDEGQLTSKKIKMVCNARLDEFALQYKMDERLHTQLQEDTLATISENRHKIYADTFEAYVGGLYLDKGYHIVRDWLHKLYEPQVQSLAQKAQTRNIVKQDSVSESKATLYKKIGSAGRKPRYVCTTETTPFTVQVWIGDVMLGEGQGASKKEAGNIAATNALKDAALIDQQAKIRDSKPRTAPVTGGLSP